MTNIYNDSDYTLLPKFPKRIMLEASNICNNRCIFCPHHNTQRSPLFLDLKFAKKILHRTFELGAQECAFHGGSEPFLHPELHKLVALAKDIGFTYIYLTTNALACSWEQMEEVLKAGLDSLKFSVNAGTEKDYKAIHGRVGFSKVLQMAYNVDRWRKEKNNKLKFCISAVTCRANIENMPQLAQNFKNYTDKIIVYPAAWLGERTKLSIKDTVARYTNNGICNEIFTRCTITSGGFVRACCSGTDEFLLIGNANNTDILDIWHGDTFVKLRTLMLEHKLPPNTVCYNCINFQDTTVKPLTDCLNSN